MPPPITATGAASYIADLEQMARAWELMEAQCLHAGIDATIATARKEAYRYALAGARAVAAGTWALA